MAIGTAGLQTHIWNNQIKSVLVLAMFPVLLLMLIFLFFALAGPEIYGAGSYGNYDLFQMGVDGMLRYGHFAILGALVWFSIAWVFQGSMIRAATGAREVTRKEAPEIYNMLENLCISRGLKMPSLQIIDTPALNAFASGIDDKSYRVTLTTGIIEKLQKDELEAVLAHELSHIRHKDVRLLIFTVIFSGMISFLCEMLYRTLVYGGGGRKKDGRLILIAFGVLAVGYVLAIILRFALSRKREYLADAGAVELTHNPDAMIRALRQISGKSDMPDMPDNIRQMCIENTHGFVGGLFATHPPIEKRIEALIAVGGRDVPLSEKPNAGARKHEESLWTGPWKQSPANWRRQHGPWG